MVELHEACGSLPVVFLCQHRMMSQELEYRILKLLENSPNLTQRQLSKELGVSLGKTHYLIKALVDVGWIKLENFQRSDSKWGYVYLLTPVGIIEKASITARFLARKQDEYARLQEEIAQLKLEVLEQNNPKRED
jgi:EPS-associated MarR family transcriptional regulator